VRHTTDTLDSPVPVGTHTEDSLAGKKKQQDRSPGQIISRGDRKWLLRIFLHRTAAGKKVYSSKVFVGTFSQARVELTRMLSEKGQGTFVAPAKKKVEEFLLEWLERKEVSGKTKFGYKRCIEIWIAPRIGMLRLDKLSAEILSDFYRSMKDASYSRSTILQCHAIIKQALHQAVQWRLLQRNEADYAVLPKGDKPKATALTSEQVHLFLERTKDDALYPLWALLLTSGIRPGEAFALRWSDYSTDGSISISRTLTKDEKGKHVIKETPKTNSGVRTIPLPASTRVLLDEHRRGCTAHMLRTGVRTEFMFATSNGQHHNPGNLWKYWRTALRTAGLPEVKLYVTRHTHATVLLDSGEDVKAVSERMGHANVKITLDTYYHPPESKKLAVAAATESLFFGRTKEA
jgi:integrase